MRQIGTNNDHRTNRPLWAAWLAVGMAFGAGCASSGSGGGGGGGTTGAGATWGPPALALPKPAATIMTYSDGATMASAPTNPPISVRVVGTKEIGGVTYERVQATRWVGTGEAPEGEPRIEAWIRTEGETITLAGAEIFDGSMKLGDAKLPDYGLTLTQPISATLDPGVGVEVEATAKGEAKLGTSTIQVDFKGTYTLESKAADVATAGASFTTAWKYTGKAKPLGKDATGELYVVPGLGVVGGSWSWPEGPEGLRGGAIGLLGSNEQHIEGGVRVAVANGTLTASGMSKLRLDSYELSGGEFDGDKMQHAKMLLEVRWADPDKAKTETQPPAVFSAGTSAGSYGTPMTKVSVSVLHPEDNGKGYTFWSTLVDQADKYAPGPNGIQYWCQIAATSDEPVFAAARMHYTLYPAP